MPTDLFGYLVFNGIVLSLAADITLLAEGNEALVVGLGAVCLVGASLLRARFFLSQGQAVAGLPGLVVFGAVRGLGLCGGNGVGWNQDCVPRWGPTP